MLYKDNRYPISIECTTQQRGYQPQTMVYTAKNMHGMLKWLSARNDVGKFIPGTFRANPVTIGTITCVANSMADLQFDFKIGAYNMRYNLVGSAAGYLAASTPVSLTEPRESWDSKLADASILKAYAKLTAPEFDVGVNLGELRETFEGLANPIAAFRKWRRQLSKLMEQTTRAYQSRKRGVIVARFGGDTLTMLGGSWLEWRMGVEPLIRSVEELLEHLRDQNDLLLGKLVRVKATVKRNSTPVTKTVISGPGSFQLTGKVVTEVSSKITTGIYYTQRSPLSLGQIYGVDAISAPAVMWELLRLSFVVDRFLRVGEYLQALRIEADTTRSIAGTVTSQKATITTTAWLQSVYPTGYPAYEKRLNHLWCSQADVLTRKVNLTKPDLPAINFNPLKWKQQLDHLALIWQALPKLDWRKAFAVAAMVDREIRDSYKNPGRPYIDPINRKFNRRR